MVNNQSLYCAYCGKSYSPDDPRERFCSQRCMKLFGTKYNISIPQSFELSDELGKLQKMLEATPQPDGDKLSKDALIIFYDTIFLQLTRILKWINSQALVQEKSLHHESLSIEELEKKLALVLTKYAHLKSENKELKLKLSVVKGGPNELAHQLLGVDKNAGKDELKKAFRAKAKAVHPDTGFSDESVFKALKMAYTYLSTTKK